MEVISGGVCAISVRESFASVFKPKNPTPKLYDPGAAFLVSYTTDVGTPL
jgi:hypothetical protein